MQEPPLKRSRGGNGDALTIFNDEEGPIRTSSLAAPTMRLTGHKGSVYALAYDAKGDTLCSGSFDKTCLLWNAANGHYENYNVLEGHKNAVLDVQFVQAGSDVVVTASADKTVGYWDTLTGSRLKRFTGHEGVVNAVAVPKSGSPHVVVSASDDCTARIWDARLRGGQSAVQLLHDYQVTAVAIDLDGNTIYTGGIDNCIHAHDIRQAARRTMTMKGHKDTITCLSICPNGNYLLSQSMDSTLKSWDIRPFASTKRLNKTFVGSTHNAEKGLLRCSWSSDASMVSGGSADRVVHIWDEYSSEELYYLPGHTGCVNSVIFHPVEKNVVASASSDNTIYVGELAS